MNGAVEALESGGEVGVDSSTKSASITPTSTFG
jgi:hypothetical protein